MCEYCRKAEELEIAGKTIRTSELQQTAGYKAPKDKIDLLELFILKGKTDKKAGLMIYNENGARYIDIDYCPFCGRKLGD